MNVYRNLLDHKKMDEKCVHLNLFFLYPGCFYISVLKLRFAFEYNQAKLFSLPLPFDVHLAYRPSSASPQ